MMQILSGTAEEGDTIARIYSMLSGTLENPETAEEYYELANIAIGQNSFDTALEYLETARGLADPADAVLISEMWLKSASVYALQSDWENTRICLDHALELDPESTQALLLQAQLLLEEGEYFAAADKLKKYVELTPSDISNWLTLAQLYENLGDYAQAKAEYMGIYAMQPDGDSHLLNALRCGFLNGDYEESLAAFDDYLINKPDADPQYRSVAAFLKAACLMQLARYDEAVAAFRAAIDEGYDATSCYEQMVLCSFDGGDYEATIQIGEEMIAAELIPASVDVFNQRMGAAMMQLERYEEAVDYLTLSIQINPGLNGSHYYRGVSYLALEMLEEAVADFTASIDAGFLLQYCYYNRGVCYVQMLDYESALNDFEVTLTIGDDQSLIDGAKDILWQLVEYYENQAAVTTEPEAQMADAETIETDAEAVDEESDIAVDIPRNADGT